MFFPMYRLWLSLLFIGCCLVVFYYLQADIVPAPLETSVPDSRRMGSPDGFLSNLPLQQENVQLRLEKLQNDLNSDFYQTIIRNNLFAPLGTELNFTPKPSAALTLVATFVSENLWRSTAVIKNEATGKHHILGIGGVLGDFTLMKIESKQVTLDHHGKRPVILHLPETVFLNVKRR